jgi:hypothetical protein
VQCLTLVSPNMYPVSLLAPTQVPLSPKLLKTEFSSPFLTFLFLTFFHLFFLFFTVFSCEKVVEKNRFYNFISFDIWQPATDVISASAVPVCFLKREASDLRYRRPSSLKTLVVALARDVVESARMTRRAAVILPKTIGSVLNSQACRSKMRKHIFCNRVLNSWKADQFD